MRVRGAVGYSLGRLVHLWCCCMPSRRQSCTACRCVASCVLDRLVHALLRRGAMADRRGVSWLCSRYGQYMRALWEPIFESSVWRFSLMRRTVLSVQAWLPTRALRVGAWLLPDALGAGAWLRTDTSRGGPAGSMPVVSSCSMRSAAGSMSRDRKALFDAFQTHSTAAGWGTAGSSGG